MTLHIVRRSSTWLCGVSLAFLVACSSAQPGTGLVPGTAPVMERVPAIVASDPDAAMPSYPMIDGINAGVPNGLLSAISTYPGAVIGKPHAFVPDRGDGPNGGLGQTIAGLPCRTRMFENSYHIHFYLGVVYRGRQLALPNALGLPNAGPPDHGFTDTASCFYYLHTHDSSGIVHVEVPVHRSNADPIYNLSRFLRVWGLQVDSTSFGPYRGPVHVFVGNVPLKQTTVSSYHPYTGDANHIMIRSHEVIWIEVGAKYYPAKQLPPVTFYMEY